MIFDAKNAGLTALAVAGETLALLAEKGIITPEERAKVLEDAKASLRPNMPIAADNVDAWFNR